MRINAICPGPTDTPLAQANKDMWLAFGATSAGGRHRGLDPARAGLPALFLCSDAAAAITGQILVSDIGYMSSGITGSFPAATAIADLLLNL